MFSTYAGYIIVERMKRLAILLLLIAALSGATPRVYAAADAYVYAVPNDRECYFCEDKNLSTALFAVPYTYCVRVISESENWLYVSYAEDDGEYKKLYGYCLKEEFTFLETPPENIYLNKTVEITYSAEGENSLLPSPEKLTRQAAYYGVYRYGAAYYSYVRCNGSFSYIAGANDDYALNELGGDDTADEDDGQTDGEEKSVSAGLIIFIAVMTLTLAVVAAIALAPHKKRTE